MAILHMIKEDIDKKVYDRNDILKKDAYFTRTVQSLIQGCLYYLPQFKPDTADYQFIRDRIALQYLNQYHATYANA